MAIHSYLKTYIRDDAKLSLKTFHPDYLHHNIHHHSNRIKDNIMSGSKNQENSTSSRSSQNQQSSNSSNTSNTNPRVSQQQSTTEQYPPQRTQGEQGTMHTAGMSGEPTSPNIEAESDTDEIEGAEVLQQQLGMCKSGKTCHYYEGSR